MSEAGELPEDCTHHWMLTSPKHEITGAVCERCGAEREFLNSDSRSPWNAGRVLKPR